MLCKLQNGVSLYGISEFLKERTHASENMPFGAKIGLAGKNKNFCQCWRKFQGVYSQVSFKNWKNYKLLLSVVCNLGVFKGESALE